MTTLISKTTSPFCHKWQRVRVSSRHLIIVGRASISILIIIIIVGVIIVLGCLGRRRGRLHKTTKVSLPSSNMTDTGVHLIHLSSECIKAIIYALKLRLIASRVTSPAEEEGAEGVGGATDSDCLERNCASLCLIVVASMAHITWKWSKMGKGTEKWHKILVIAEGKMSLSWVVVSLCTSIMERMKWEGKFIVRCSNGESKNQARGLLIEL